MKLRFFGGVNEIGGNKILVEDNDTKLFFDFGFSFSTAKKYFSEFLGPRSFNILADYFELGILPDLYGIYRSDYLVKIGRKPEELAIEGVFLTHAHADHSQNISLLNKDARIYCGETTKLFLKIIQDTARGGVETEIHDYKKAFVNRRRKESVERNFKTFRTGKNMNVNDVSVEPIHVDHSIPGSYGFVIHGSETVAYTGDLRLHGPRNDMTLDFVEKAKEAKPDVLIIEGTRVDKNERGLSEEDVKNKISDFIKNTKKLVVANFSWKDIDRLNSFYQACKENERILAISPKQAYMLEVLKKDTKLKVPYLKDEYIAIYLPREGWGIVAEEFPLEEKKKDYVSKKWMHKFLEYKNAVTYKDINKKQQDYVFFCDYFSLNELIDVKPEPGSIYIYSTSEPHDEEQAIDYERMLNWLEHFGLEFKEAHASGHACAKDLKWVIEEIKPKRVIPIHTQHAELFKRLTKTKILLPEKGE
jgi:ribonuclease J